MKRSMDWLNQAEADIKAAKNSKNSGDYAWSCFLSQQAGEKAVKALGEELNLILWGHDLVDLLKEIKKIISITKKIDDGCKALNIYYISTRYPDAFTSGYPAEKFSESQAEEALKISNEVLSFARSKIEENRTKIEESSKD